MKKHGISVESMTSYVDTQFLNAFPLLSIGLSDAEVVHELRVILKRLRAVVLLLKSDDGFADIDAEIKKLSKALSARRDHDVVEEWLGENPGVVPQKIVPKLQQLHSPRTDRWSKPIAEVHRRLLLLEPAFIKLLAHQSQAELNGRKTIRSDIRKIKHAAQRAKESNKADDYHTLRKRIKTFRFQMESLGLTSHKKVKKIVRQGKSFAELLGQGHDLEMIGKTFKELDQPELRPVSRKVLARSQQLNRKALKKTNRLLKELT